MCGGRESIETRDAVRAFEHPNNFEGHEAKGMKSDAEEKQALCTVMQRINQLELERVYGWTRYSGCPPPIWPIPHIFLLSSSVHNARSHESVIWRDWNWLCRWMNTIFGCAYVMSHVTINFISIRLAPFRMVKKNAFFLFFKIVSVVKKWYLILGIIEKILGGSSERLKKCFFLLLLLVSN